jgi:hypothetical protein
MADYECCPLWRVGDEYHDEVDPDDLPLSPELKERLMEWAQVFDEILDVDSPQDAGFKSEALEAAFRAEGDDLAECLAAELGPGYLITKRIY